MALRWTASARGDLARLHEFLVDYGVRYELAGEDMFVLRILHTREDR